MGGTLVASPPTRLGNCGWRALQVRHPLLVRGRGSCTSRYARNQATQLPKGHTGPGRDLFTHLQVGRPQGRRWAAGGHDRTGRSACRSDKRRPCRRAHAAGPDGHLDQTHIARMGAPGLMGAGAGKRKGLPWRLGRAKAPERDDLQTEATQCSSREGWQLQGLPAATCAAATGPATNGPAAAADAAVATAHNAAATARRRAHCRRCSAAAELWRQSRHFIATSGAPVGIQPRPLPGCAGQAALGAG